MVICIINNVKKGILNNTIILLYCILYINLRATYSIFQLKYQLTNKTSHFHCEIKKTLVTTKHNYYASDECIIAF